MPTTATSHAVAHAHFVDANDRLGVRLVRLRHPGDRVVKVNRQPDIDPGAASQPGWRGTPIALIDQLALPTIVAARCMDLKRVVPTGDGLGLTLIAARSASSVRCGS